jgi:uncharacterized protein
VLCHPHPAHGGTMQSVVVSPLFSALPAMGVATLRFNFRGVQQSQGSFDGGNGEVLDVEAAVIEHRSHDGAQLPLLLVGFSFGADMAMSCVLPEVDAYCLIAPPFHFGAGAGAEQAIGADPRAKLVVLAAHDEFRDPQWASDHTQSWVNARCASVPGANHFFVARTDQLIDVVRGFVDEVVAQRP